MVEFERAGVRWPRGRRQAEHMCYCCDGCDSALSRPEGWDGITRPRVSFHREPLWMYLGRHSSPCFLMAEMHGGVEKK